MAEDSLEIVDSVCFLGDAISCGGGVESPVRDRIPCAWSKWRELASLLVYHSISTRGKSEGLLCVCEACIAVCCGNVGTNRKTGRSVSCNHELLRYM